MVRDIAVTFCFKGVMVVHSDFWFVFLVDNVEDDEVDQLPLLDNVRLPSSPSVDKGKGIAIEGDEADRPGDVEAGSFKAFA